MNFEFFIARRIYFKSEGNKRQIAKPAIRIATIGMALGLVVMIVSLCVVMGFKREVRSKVIGLTSHIQVSNYFSGQSYETLPIAATDSLLSALRSTDGVSHAQRYTTKLGLIKTDTQFQGIIYKGIGQEYDLSFLRHCLVEGEIPAFTDSVASNKVLLSKALADKLQLRLGDAVYTYYLQKDVRVRKLTIAGIYRTNFSDYDNLFLIGDLYTATRLNRWSADQVSGVELQLTDFNRLDEVSTAVGSRLSDAEDRYGNTYFAQTVVELNPQLFAWLSVLDLNVWVILILMMGVAGFSMISGLLIIILERTNMIGVLKALGGSNGSIQRLFLYFSAFIIGKGMLWGNIIALALCFVQWKWRFVKLDPANYYIDAVPVYFSPCAWLLLNVAAFVVSILILVGPSFLISNIKPAKSIRFE